MLQKNSAFSEIIDFLIQKYGQDLGITRDTFIPEFSKQSRISKKTVNHWLNGKKDEKKNITIREKSKQALAKYFKVCIPNIEPSWFDVLSLHKFKELLEFSKEKTININIISEYSGAGKLQDDIERLIYPSGLFYLYRYAFINDNKYGGRIAKELIHIEEKDNELLCNYYFRIKGVQNSNTLKIATGKVISFKNNYCIFVVTKDTDQYITARPRVIIMKKEAIHPSTEDYKFGIMTGSSAINDEPCSARVVLYREKSLVCDIKEFAHNNVKFLTYDEFKSCDSNENIKILDVISNDINNKNDNVLTISTESLRKSIIN